MSKLITPFLLLLLHQSFSKPCPSCGPLAIPFPLSTSPSCNNPSYTLRCTANSSLFLDALSHSYPISSISPSSQSLTISLLPIPPSSCSSSDTASGGLLLNSSAPFNISSANSIFFLNCSSSILLSPLNCSASSACHAYLNSSSDAFACKSSPICCEFRAGGSSTAYALRTNPPTGCSAYRSFVDLDTGRLPVVEWRRREGVSLEWVDPPEPVCGERGECEDGENSTCRVDEKAAAAGATVRRCFCNRGFRWDSIAGLCAYSKWVVILMDIIIKFYAN